MNNHQHLAFTVVSPEQLAGALVLREALGEGGAGMRLLICLLDPDGLSPEEYEARAAACAPRHAGGLAKDLRSLNSRDVPHWNILISRHSSRNLATLVRPSLFLDIAAEFPSTVLHFMEPDVYVCGALESWKAAAEAHALVFCPLFLVPPDRGGKTSGRQADAGGDHFPGSLAWNPAQPGAREIMLWWQKQTLEADSGLSAEGTSATSWKERLSGFSNTLLLKDPSFQVAACNLHERDLRHVPGRGYFVNGNPLQFFHFTGWDPRHPNQFPGFAEDVFLPGLRGLSALTCDYVLRLKEAGLEFWAGNISAMTKSPDATPGRGLFISPLEYARMSATNKVLTLVGKPSNSLLISGVLWWFEFATSFVWAWALSTAGRASSLHSCRFLLRPHPETQNHKRIFQQGLLRSLLGSRKPSGTKPPLEKRPTEVRGPSFQEPGEQASGSGTLRGVAVGYATAETGLGESFRGILRAFDAAQSTTYIHDITSIYARCQDDEFAGRVNNHPPADSQLDFSILKVSFEQFLPTLRGPLGGPILKSSKRISYWYWETESFPRRIAALASYADEIWVATKFVRDAVTAGGVSIPVKVIPPALGRLPTELLPRNHFGLPEGRPLVLSIFDSVSYIGRKNPMAVIEAMKRVCARLRDRPILVFKTTNLSDEQLASLRKLAGSLDMIVINKYITRREILSLIHVSDVFVSLYRSEGLGLPVVDAMRLGRQVVATNYSGPSDFLTPENSFPVPWKYVEAGWDDGPYYGSRWADPDVDHASEALIQALTPDPVRARKAREDIENHFAVDRVRQLISGAFAGAPQTNRV